MKMRLFIGPIAALSLLLGIASNAVGSSAATGESYSLPAAQVAVDRNDAGGTRLSVAIPEFGSLENAADASALNRPALADEPSSVLPGYPQLPMVTRTILIPPTTGVRLIIHGIDSRLESDFDPFITPPQDGSVNPDLPGVPSDDYLRWVGFWPPEPIVVSEPAIVRGYRVAQVTLFPIQVNPSTGERRINENFDFELAFEGEGENVVANPSRRPTHIARNMVEGLVVNPEQIRLYRDDLPGRGCYMLLYINNNGWANALQPLIDWRKRQGWNVVAVGFNGGVSNANIKQRIQQQYDGDNPPEMIALVGDPDNSGIPAWPGNFTDIDYALLEGRDILADADYGRISCESTQELERVVAKIINYESNPWMDDVDWYNRGAVCAGNQISGISTIFVSKWVRRETLDRTWNDVAEWYFNAGQGSVPEFFSNQLRRGVNYITYRGWIGMEGINSGTIMGWQAHRRYPFATTMTCASGNYIGTFGNTEAFFRSAGGAIGAIGFCTSNTHVQYNNAVFTGIWVGVLKKGLTHLGSACNWGRYETWRQYAGFEDGNVVNFSSWANLMGDPATDMFTDIPELIEVSHDEALPLGISGVRIVVNREEDGSPVAGATVCLYKADDEFQTVLTTNEEGVAEFALLPDQLSDGDLLVTVTKHNTKPYLGSIDVAEAENYIGAHSWEVTEDTDSDGEANPGEEFNLLISLKNFGTAQPEGGLSITCESHSPWAVASDEAIGFDAAPGPGEAIDPVAIPVRLDASTPDDVVIPLKVTASANGEEWTSFATVTAVSPRSIIEALHLPNNRLDPGSVANLDISMKNIGGKRLERAHARLWTNSDVVNVVSDEANFPAADPNATVRLDGAVFRVRAHPFTIPGMTVRFFLAVETEAGFRDTTSISLAIGRPEADDPFGPDKYGYVCFDSGDEGWEMRPEYDWIEINPDAQGRDFQGTRLNLQDGGEDADRSIAIDLPIAFQYYGEVFDRITICTNGWAAFGNWSELADFRNRRIASGEGPNAQLSVFHDDLSTDNQSRILTYHDADGGRFIVEWYKMRSLASGAEETFQLILYDTEIHQTYSGDGIIVYQYNNVQNVGQPGPSNDTPYVTIGIGNLDDTDGLEYTYYNSYAPGAMRLQNELAIKFTTAVQYITGRLCGYVTDAATGEAVATAEITTPRGFWGETDSTGYFFIDDILIGDYGSLTITKQGYNDSTWTGFAGEGYGILQGDSIRIDIALLHPEFNLDVNEFEFEMLDDSVATTGFTITNDGNGTLGYSSRYVYVVDQPEAAREEEPAEESETGRDEADEQWDELLTWDATTPTENIRIQTLVYIDDHWLLAGGHIGEGLNYFYEFDRNGAYTGNRFEQPVGGLFGIRALAYDGQFLYAAYPDSSHILRLDPMSGQELARWRTPRGFNNGRNLTIDPETGHFFACAITSRLYELELVGDTALVEVRNFRTMDPRDPQSEIHRYGIAWFPDDPDGFKLYIISNDELIDDPDNRHPNISLYKMNTETGEIRYLTDFGFLDPAAQARNGLAITPKWNNLVYAIAAVFDHPSADFVSVFELAPNSSWIDYSPRSDTLFSGEAVAIDLQVATAELDTGRYGVVIEFHHNAGDGRTRVPVNLHVVDSLRILVEPEIDAPTPLEYALEPAWPNPFNSRTTISYALKQAGPVELKLYDSSGRLIADLLGGRQEAGRYRLAFDGEHLAGGLYFYRLKAGSFTKTQKLLLVK